MASSARASNSSQLRTVRVLLSPGDMERRRHARYPFERHLAGEVPQPAEQRLGVRVQQAVRPLQRRAQPALPVREVSAALAERVRGAPQALEPLGQGNVDRAVVRGLEALVEAARRRYGETTRWLSTREIPRAAAAAALAAFASCNECT